MDIVERLRAAGLRPTRQRVALARLLFDGCDRHVTAELLHEEAQVRKVPVSLADVGITAKDLNKLAEDAMKQTRLLVNNPRDVSFDDALAIYTEAFGNRTAA